MPCKCNYRILPHILWEYYTSKQEPCQYRGVPRDKIFVITYNICGIPQNIGRYDYGVKQGYC